MSKEENKVFESFGDKKNAARTGADVSPEGLQWGDASLQLPGVQLRDAGEYRCEVVVPPQKAEGRVLLEVLGEYLRAMPCNCHGAGSWGGGAVGGSMGRGSVCQSVPDMGSHPGLHKYLGHLK